ncbi:MAG: FtsX-like permease family protein, partial [Pseudomonadota bacterium]
QPIVIIKDGQPSTVPGALLTDSNLFDVLEVPFIKGDSRHALDDPHSLVLGQKAATKLFGAADPMGQTVTLSSGDLKADYRVTGVHQDLPKNSSLSFGMVARFDPVTFRAKAPEALTSWNWQEGTYWVKLKSVGDDKLINSQIPAWKKRNMPPEASVVDGRDPGEFQDFKLTNIRDVHLGEAQNGAQRPGNDRGTIVTFAIIALLILGMACVNFTNLATARATQRAREVALRKVLGATRGQLITQFIGESILLATAAMVVALAIVELTLPALNGFLDAQISIRYFALDGLIGPVILLTLLVGLAGGLYPALVLSRFEPARVLKANKSAADAEGSGRLRSVLVVGQFAVSIGLIICTLIVYTQTVYARSADGGFHREGLLQITNLDRPQVDQIATSLVDEIKRIPGVTSVGRTSIAVDNGRHSATGVKLAGSADVVQLGVYPIDPGFVPAMGMKLLAGRNFSLGQPMDDASLPSPRTPEAQRALVQRGANIMLSEEAARRLGFKTPAAAIGKQIMVSMVSDEYGLVPATVIGVVNDVRFRSAREPLQPNFYFFKSSGYPELMVRFQGVEPKVMSERVEASWKRLVPDVPYRARLVDDIVNEMYNQDAARAALFGAFAILAVVIGCLGLFGLAAFTAERRTKEIGIRKVLGAGNRDIVQLLVWQFSRPVLIANIIAWPLAWWVMRGWLNGFDTRITLTPVPFLEAGLLALLIAVGTISAHAYRVARTNPIKALRYE